MQEWPPSHARHGSSNTSRTSKKPENKIKKDQALLSNNLLSCYSHTITGDTVLVWK
jgi:hypothetical protein